MPRMDKKISLHTFEDTTHEAESDVSSNRQSWFSEEYFKTHKSRLSRNDLVGCFFICLNILYEGNETEKILRP